MLSAFFRTWRASGALPLLLLGVPASLGQNPASSDPSALVRRAVANRLAEEAAHHPLRFVFHRQDGRRDSTQEIVETAQGDVARLVAVNGVALTPAARQLEMNRLNALAADPALQQHRLRREQADQARIDKLLRLLPDAFAYTYVDTSGCEVAALPATSVPGVPGAPPGPEAAPPAAPSQCYHLTFMPNPKWQPQDIEERVLAGMAGDIWIETRDERLHKLNAHLISDVEFGWGIVGKLNKGGTIFLEQDRIAANDWELTRMKMNLTGKALLLKTIDFHLDEQESGFEPVPANLDYRQAIRMLEASPPFAGK